MPALFLFSGGEARDSERSNLTGGMGDKKVVEKEMKTI
jgi:hypothetical protein